MTIHKWLPLLLSVLSLGLSTQMGRACGLSWGTPSGHYNGVDYQGHVMLVEKLGDIEATQKFSLPLFLMFESDNEQISPYLGYGWRMPLLESKVVQIDENTFKIKQPDGHYRLYSRDAKNSSLLNAQGGWIAEIQNDTITATAQCGVKLIFKKGILSTMILKEHTFTYVYGENNTTELREGSTVCLKISRALSGQITEVRINDAPAIMLEQAERPRVQVVGGQTVVAGLESALSKISKTGAPPRTFDYALDKTRRPSIHFDDRTLIWDPTTKCIISDGGWTYEIAAGTGLFDNASITRKNAKNQKESWYRNNIKGEEITMGVAGTKTVTTWFTAGQLGGKLRKIETVTPQGEKKLSALRTYDEAGRILRDLRPDGTENHYEYNKENQKVSTFQNNKEVRTSTFDTQGKPLQIVDAMGNLQTYIYSDNKKTVKHTDKTGTVTHTEYFENDLLVKHDLGSRQETISYVPGTKKILDIVWNDGTIYHQVYDQMGKLDGVMKNGKYVWKLYTDGKTGQIIRVFLRGNKQPYKATECITGKNCDLPHLIEQDPEFSKFIQNLP